MFQEQNLSKKIDKGFNCKDWTKQQCEQFLFIDFWDTLRDLEKRQWTFNAKVEKEVFEKLKDMSYYNLNALFQGANVRLKEIAIKAQDKELLQKIRINSKLAKKEGIY